MNLLTVDIPPNSIDIIKLYKNFKKQARKKWCLLKYKESVQAKNQFVNDLKTIQNNQDSPSMVRLCIGALILYSNSSARVNECCDFISKISIPKDKGASEFISIMISKFSDRVKQSNIPFAQKQIQNIHNYFKDPNSSKYVLSYALNLLVAFSINAYKLLGQYSNLYYDTIFLASQNTTYSDCRYKAAQALEIYLFKNRNREFPQILLNKLKSPLKESTQNSILKTQGLIILQSIICSAFPTIFAPNCEQLMKSFFQYCTSGEPIIRLASMQMLISLAPIKPDIFLSKYQSTIVSQLSSTLRPSLESAKVVLYLLDKFPSALSDKIEYLLNTIQLFLEIDQFFQIGVQILNKINEKMHSIISNEERLTHISIILFKSPQVRYNDDLIQTVVNLFKQNESFLPLFFPYFLCKIGELIPNSNISNTNSAEIGFKLLGALPNSLYAKIGQTKFSNQLTNFSGRNRNHPFIDESDNRGSSQFMMEIQLQLSDLIKKIQEIMLKPDLLSKEIKSLIPLALISLAESQPQNKQKQIIEFLLRICINEESEENRVAILQAIQEPYKKFLAFSYNIRYFSNLLSCESNLVKKEALRIIAGVCENNPAEIYPIIRHQLLNTLYICEHSHSLLKRSEQTSLLSIFFSIPNIISLYSSTFLPIALNYLQTYIDATDNFFEIHPDPSFNVDSSQKSNNFNNTDQNLDHSDKQPEKRKFSSSNSFIKNSNFGSTMNDTSSNLDEHLTFFEHGYIVQIANNYIEAIHCIANLKYEFISNYVIKIFKIFIQMLSRETNKKVVISLLATIETIITAKNLLKFPNGIHKTPTSLRQNQDIISNLYLALLSLGSRVHSVKVQRRLFRIFGFIGPFQLDAAESFLSNSTDSISYLFKVGTSITYDDYFARVIITNLMALLNDQGTFLRQEPIISILSKLFYRYSHFPSTTYTEVTKSTAEMRFRDHSSVVSKLFPQFFNKFLSLSRNIPYDEKAQYFNLLETILDVPRDWIQPFTTTLFNLIWSEMNINMIDVIHLVAKVIYALGDSMLPYIPKIIGFLLETLSQTETCNNSPKLCISIITVISLLSDFVSDYLSPIIHTLTNLIMNKYTNFKIINSSLITLCGLACRFDISPYSSLLIRICLYSFSINLEEIRLSASQLLYHIAIFNQEDFSLYKDTITQFLTDNSFNNTLAHLNEILTTQNPSLSNFSFIIKSLSFDSQNTNLNETDNCEDNGKAFIEKNHQQLINALSALIETTPEEWKFKRFQQAIVSLSPSIYIRQTVEIAQVYPNYLRGIFHAAFLSVWIMLEEVDQAFVQTHILTLIGNPSIPNSVLGDLTSLDEFMERARNPFPIANHLNRTKVALKSEKPPFALRCAQIDYEVSHHSVSSIAHLTKIYSMFGLFDETRAILVSNSDIINHESKSRDNFHSEFVSDKLYDLLGNWDNILTVYPDLQNFDQRLKLMEMLEDWEGIIKYYDKLHTLSISERQKVGVIFARAFYKLGMTKEYKDAISACGDYIQAHILAARVALHNNQIEESLKLVDKAFDNLSARFGSLFSHGLTSVRPFIIMAEELIEISEIARSSQSTKSVSNSTLGKLWSIRTQISENTPFSILSPLFINRIEIAPKDIIIAQEMEYLKLARKAGEKSLYEIFYKNHYNDFGKESLAVGLEDAKMLWRKEQYQDALAKLDDLIEQSTPYAKKNELGSMYFLKAKWISRLNYPQNPDKYSSTFENSYLEAAKAAKLSMQYRPNHEQAYHLWAFINSHLFSYYLSNENESRTIFNNTCLMDSFMRLNSPEKKALLSHSDDEDSGATLRSMNPATNTQMSSSKSSIYAINAIEGFVQCLTLSDNTNAFPCILQLYSILFRISKDSNIYYRLKGTLKKLKTEQHLNILQQLIGYQDTQSVVLKAYLTKLLEQILNLYPDQSIFPMLFSFYFGKTKNSIINGIVNRYWKYKPNLCNCAKSIIFGLQQICITMPEYIYNAYVKLFELEAAINSKGTDKHEIEEEFFKFVKSVQNHIETVSTEYDLNFVDHPFQRKRLNKFLMILSNCVENHTTHISQQNREAMKIYAKQIKKAYEEDGKLKLSSVSPILASIKSTPLAVFGTFVPNDRNKINIQRFGSEINIKHTKQRPRKINILGSNGLNYPFLLKGREDLRADQRIIQFFKLMNTIIPSSQPRIATMEIVPLTPSMGLIEWFHSCDTIYDLITQYRQIQGHNVLEEQSFMEKNSISSLKSLTSIQRYEIYNMVYNTFPANDLREVLWLKANDSDQWARKVSIFSKSSAQMSMIGYIIGLGDRHPANIMLRRENGAVIHVDFGDVFESTMRREQYPETVPFRLTRMMENALGSCGVNGSFKSTCRQTIRLIRQHRDVIMAVLEIFVREPIQNDSFFIDFDLDQDVGSGSRLINDELEEDEHDEHGEEKECGEKNEIVATMDRISNKMEGTDFKNEKPMSVEDQVDKLIKEAKDLYNLSALYVGWNPMW